MGSRVDSGGSEKSGSFTATWEAGLGEDISKSCRRIQMKLGGQVGCVARTNCFSFDKTNNTLNQDVRHQSIYSGREAGSSGVVPQDDETDNDLEGEAGSVLMGSADVRRSIPIKLISERPGALRVGTHPWKKYKAHNTTSEREVSVGFGDNGFQHDDFGADHDKPLRIIWNCKINILGRKEETPIHFCDKCALPIKIYGRMVSIWRRKICIC
uniref:Uncharacterized protein n=1 Tax=Eptatretus burgeri TaxID=7764 RepID=A0A8C4Q8L4_EPTBU